MAQGQTAILAASVGSGLGTGVRLRDGVWLVEGMPEQLGALNHVDKDEVLDVIPATDKRAEHDRKFFEEKWKLGTVVQ